MALLLSTQRTTLKNAMNEVFPRPSTLKPATQQIMVTTDFSQFLINNDGLVQGANIQDRKCKIMKQKKKRLEQYTEEK